MAGKVVDVTLQLVDKITSPLKGINSKLTESANQWVRAGKQIQKAGNNITNVGTKMTKSLTVPILGAGAAALKVASDFESGMSKVQSISGATESEMDMLSEKAKEMGAKMKYSATEASDAFSYMAMAGWKAADMEAGIEGVMYLAGATGEDLANTTDIVTDALTAFGKEAKDAGMFADVLAKTSSMANTNVSMLGESFKYVAPVAGALGYDVQDVSTALGIMANSGIKASTAGTSLRTWMSNMSAPTSSVASAMEELGISLTDSEGNMKDFETVMRETRGAFDGLTESEKAMYAKTLAGKQGMSGLLAIVNSSDKDFNKLADGIDNSTGACEEMYKVANDNLQGQLTVLKSTVESIAISFGEKLTPYVSILTTKLQSLAEKFNNLSDEQQNTIIKIGLIVAAAGPALAIFGKMVSTVGKGVSIVGKFGKALKAAGSIMGLITSPAGIAIAVLGALVVAGVLVVKNWDKIKKACQKVFGYVKSVFKGIGKSGESMKEKLTPIGEKFNEIKEKIVEFWYTVEPLFTAIGEVVASVFEVGIGAAIGAAIGAFSSLFDSVTSVIGDVMDIFGGLIDFVTGVFSGDWSKAWQGIVDTFGGIFALIGDLVKAPINAVISIINGAIQGINKIHVEIPDWVPGIGGNEFGINIPTIPTLAKGTDDWKGGIVQISERGGEIVDLPSGSRVYPHDETVKKAYQDGAKNGSVVINIPKLADNISVRNDSDIDRIAQALADKLEKVSNNIGGGNIGYSY